MSPSLWYGAYVMASVDVDRLAANIEGFLEMHLTDRGCPIIRQTRARCVLAEGLSERRACYNYF